MSRQAAWGVLLFFLGALLLPFPTYAHASPESSVAIDPWGSSAKVEHARWMAFRVELPAGEDGRFNVTGSLRFLPETKVTYLAYSILGPDGDIALTNRVLLGWTVSHNGTTVRERTLGIDYRNDSFAENHLTHWQTSQEGVTFGIGWGSSVQRDRLSEYTLILVTNGFDVEAEMTMRSPHARITNATAGNEILFARLSAFDSELHVRHFGVNVAALSTLTYDSPKEVIGTFLLHPEFWGSIYENRAYWTGPDGRGQECNILSWYMKNFCLEWLNIIGPPGRYEFVVDYNVVALSTQDDVWVLLGIMDLPR